MFKRSVPNVPIINNNDLSIELLDAGSIESLNKSVFKKI